MPNHRRDAFQIRRNVGLSCRFGFGQQSKNIAQLTSLAACRKTGVQLLRKSHQADGILLMNHQVTQRRRQTDAVVKLGQFLPIGVRHAFREIHQQITRDIGFRLILLHEKTIGFRKHQPVNISRVVSLRVPAMFAEFDAEPLKRA